MKHSSTYKYKLSIAASTENLSDVRSFIDVHAKDHGFSEKIIQDIRLAVDEAVTNIIKHAYSNDSSEIIDVELLFSDNKLCIQLFDSGKTFKFETYKMPNIKEQVKRKKRGGMGVYLIHSLMDKVSYSSNGDKNEIRMCKNRS